ncbi:DUF5123 domain-containing protein [Sphingobacterium sp. LRF_L2]|uniref:DUF5123 domain-containing protein n=1 Tax=Sphingobacterium sp. LRF_L2 TaxID=3369421 RepID=UPI003F6158F9
MNNLKINLLQLCIVGMLTITSISCSKELTELTSLDYDRFFSVQNIEVSQNEQTFVVLVWDAPKHATGDLSYTVEVAQDNNFAGGAEYTFESETNALTITDADILVRTTYYARIKVNGEENVSESKWSVSPSFKIAGLQLLQSAKYENITSTTVQLYWTVPSDVTHLTLNDVSYNIDEEEKTNGSKLISGLTPSTTYEAIIFDGTANKGTITFSTKDGVPSGNIINVSANPADASQSLESLLNTAKSGDVYVLEQGGHYSLTTVTLPNGSITLFGAEGTDKPILTVSGQINLPTTGGIIKFQNIHFSGYEGGLVGQGTKNNYIFNQSAACNIEELIFENCEIRHLTNSPMRLQNANNAKTIQKLSFNQCIVEDIGVNAGGNGSYCFINNNVANNVIQQITISNSTFSSLGYGLLLHNNSPSESVTIESCTFYNIIGTGRILIDYNAQSYGAINIRNSIFAKHLAVTSPVGGVRGSGSLSVSNSFKTSDLDIDSSRPLTGITTYTGSSIDLFNNPAGSNFTFKDASFEGKNTSGDPRWR